MSKIRFQCVVLAFVVFLLVAEAAKKASEKAKTMARLSSESGTAMITDSNYKDLVTSKRRNYHLLLLFTVSLPERKCSHCQHATEAFEEAAMSWRNSEQFDSSLFFAKADFDHDGMNVFQAFDVNTAPLVYFFHADGGKHQSLFMEKYGFSPEGYAQFVERAIGTKIEIEKPSNIAPLFAIFSFVLFFLTTIKLGWLKWAVVEEVAGTSVGLFSVVFVTMMSSGFMWNHMRGAPLWSMEGTEAVYIAKWSDSQLVSESIIILVINLMIGVGMVLMSEGDKPAARKNLCAWGGLAVTVGFYYSMWSIFCDKYHGYPRAFFFL